MRPSFSFTKRTLAHLASSQALVKAKDIEHKWLQEAMKIRRTACRARELLFLNRKQHGELLVLKMSSTHAMRVEQENKH